MTKKTLTKTKKEKEKEKEKVKVKTTKTKKSNYDIKVKPYLEKIINLRRKGTKIDDIAKILNISKQTFYNYKEKYQELELALSEAQEQLNNEIVNIAETSLLNKLKDRYVITETINEAFTDENGKIIKRHIYEKKKLVLADTTALIFALKARKADVWNTDEHELIKAKQEELKQKTGKDETNKLIQVMLNKYTKGD